MKIKRIVLFPTQGFGNRIKAIVSAKILSEYLKIPLHINWINEKCINAEYRDIFSDDPNFLGDDIIQITKEKIGITNSKTYTVVGKQPKNIKTWGY